MPLIKKVIGFGRTSRGVILPASWFKWCENKLGKKVEKVCLEMKDNTIIIYPYVEKE